MMEASDLDRIIFLAENSIFRSSEDLRKLVFSRQFSSPQLEQVVQQMQLDLCVLLNSARELSKQSVSNK